MRIKLFSFVFTLIANFLIVYYGKPLDNPAIILAEFTQFMFVGILFYIRSTLKPTSQKVIEGSFYGLIFIVIFLIITLLVLNSFKW